MPSLVQFAMELSQAGVGFARDVLSGEAFLPRGMALNALGISAVSVEAVAALLPDSSERAGWQEFANKLRAYRLFASAEREFDGVPGGPGTLGRVLNRISGLDPYTRVWTMEGVGQYYARFALSNGGLQNSGPFPEHAVIPLHTGAGLAIAQDALRSAGSSGIRDMLRGFWKACRQTAMTGYAEAVFEALGLVTIAMYPHLTGEIDRELSTSNPDLADYFWHGVGRGLYFSPLSLLPCGAARGWPLAASQRIPPSDAGRGNALAGLAWALTLVNIRDPAILQCYAREFADRIGGDGAFENGVTSSLLIWQNAAPDDPHLERLCRYRPDGEAELWERAMAAPAARAMRWYPSLRSRNLLGAAFRVQPLEVMADQTSGQVT